MIWVLLKIDVFCIIQEYAPAYTIHKKDYLAIFGETTGHLLLYSIAYIKKDRSCVKPNINKNLYE